MGVDPVVSRGSVNECIIAKSSDHSAGKYGQSVSSSAKQVAGKRPLRIVEVLWEDCGYQDGIAT